MNRSRIYGAVAAVGLAMVSLGGAHAALATDGSGGATTTWLSGALGDDANPCSRTAPCKTLMGSFAKTAQPNGQILVEDPGNFGSSASSITNPTITGGIVIDGTPGIAADAVAVAGLDGLDIAAAANDVVVLRHLDFEGKGIGLHGINFISGKALYIEDSTIEGFTGDAVHMAPAAGGQLVLDNVTLRNNGQNGVNAAGGSSAAMAKVTIKNSRLEANAAAGVLAADSSDVAVSGSSLTGNGQGLACVIQAAGNCTINATSNAIGQSTTGVLSGRGVVSATGSTTVYLSGNTITGNTKGMGLTAAPRHAAIISFGDNTVADNTVAGAPTSTATKL